MIYIEAKVIYGYQWADNVEDMHLIADEINKIAYEYDDNHFRSVASHIRDAALLFEHAVTQRHLANMKKHDMVGTADRVRDRSQPERFPNLCGRDSIHRRNRLYGVFSQPS